LRHRTGNCSRKTIFNFYENAVFIPAKIQFCEKPNAGAFSNRNTSAPATAHLQNLEAMKDTFDSVGDLFDNYYIGEISYRFTCLLEMAVGSPLFIEQPPHKRAELVSDTVYILRFLDNLASAYEADMREAGVWYGFQHKE